MFKMLLSLALLSFTFFLISAQTDGLLFNNHIYQDNIKTVEFHVDFVDGSFPVYELFSSGQLRFAFDDMDADYKTYTYRVYHCTADWKLSNEITTMDYIEGFDEENLDEFEYSFNTQTEYTHYEIRFPNNDMSVRLSGNYLFVVYEDEDEKTPVITRRFVVVEPLTVIQPQMTRPSDVSKYHTHHEFDFNVIHDKNQLKNPRNSIHVTILQNANWNIQKSSIRPLFARSDEKLEFDYQDRIVFDAKREFRPLDIRSLRNSSLDVEEINRYDDGYHVTLKKDHLRKGLAPISYVDLNGHFIIESRERADAALEGDYANVLFTLEATNAYKDVDFYIYGSLSDWELKEEFKMAYNPQFKAYVGMAQLKQGFYNYYYVASTPDKKQMDFSITEGSDNKTENEYTIIVYYSPFGSRYNRVIGVHTFDSTN